MTCPSEMQPAFGGPYQCQREAGHPRLHEYVFHGADGPITIKWNEQQAITPLPSGDAASQIERHIARHAERITNEFRTFEKERLKGKIEGLKVALAIVKGEKQ